MRSKLVWPLISIFALFTLLSSAHAELLPIVSKMLENLAAINLIERGFALEDLNQVARGAEEIIGRSDDLRKLSSDDLDIDHSKKPKFNAHLDLLVEHANTLRSAALKGKTDKAVDAFRLIVEEGCTPCHKEFREEGGELKLDVYLMTSVMKGLEEIDRGALLNDYWLIASSAREVQDVARLMQWDQVIDSTFKIEPSGWKEFKKYARKLDKIARRIEIAAEDRNEAGVFKGIRAMMNESCLPCHDDFRKAHDHEKHEHLPKK
jgi:cytochrome c556